MNTIKRLGKNQREVLEFLRDNPGWHPFARDIDNATRKAINSLADHGLVEITQHQFRAAAQTGDKS